MASVYPRGQIQWIKFYPPGRSAPCRKSLGAINPAMAELVRRKLELELALRQPELRDVVLPENILKEIGDPPPLADLSVAVPRAAELIPPPMPPVPSIPPAVTAEKVVREYLAFIAVENSPHHAKNKTTHLKKFFGSAMLGLDEPEKEPGVFKGTLLSEVKAADVQEMIDGLVAGKKTKRHYRNTFHSLLEFALKREHYIPTNYRYPNPMSALPTYHEKNKKIVFLTQENIDHVLKILEPCPPVRVAVAIMIYAGLRRAEMLWLRKENLAAGLKFMSVVNKTDEEGDLESSLKTGERSVPIMPPLRAILEEYLATLQGEWLVPSPTGRQWIGENFGDRHRELLRAAELRHTCLHYRHTFATQRAAEGWSLFRIAKAMGNSVAVVERYYAAFVDPSLA